MAVTKYVYSNPAYTRDLNFGKHTADPNAEWGFDTMPTIAGQTALGVSSLGRKVGSVLVNADLRGRIQDFHLGLTPYASGLVMVESTNKRPDIFKLYDGEAFDMVHLRAQANFVRAVVALGLNMDLDLLYKIHGQTFIDALLGLSLNGETGQTDQIFRQPIKTEIEQHCVALVSLDNKAAPFVMSQIPIIA